jgi:hypothetical protein
MSSLSKGNLSEIADIYSDIHSPKTHQENLSESVEVISEEALDGAALIVLSTLAEHLIENKLAEDYEDCFKIFEHMSDEWLEQILDEKLEATCNLLEEELKEALVLQEADDGGMGGFIGAVGTGLRLLKGGWHLGKQALTKGRQSAGFVKNTVAKDLRKNYNIPAGQSVAKELSKRAVSNTSRVATGAVRRVGDALTGAVKTGRGAWDYAGERIGDVQKLARFVTGVGAKRRTPLGIRGKLNTAAAAVGIPAAVDMISTGGYKGSATEKIVNAAKDAISRQLNQQSRPQQTQSQTSNGNKNKNWWDQI